MQDSAISWTDGTFNPWWGCWPVSPGCALCYAARDAERYGWTDGGGSGPDLWKKSGPRRVFGDAHWFGKNSPRRWALTMPAELGRRPRIFTASMSDIGEDHPIADQERPKLWRLIEETPQLDWLLLTKRVATARQWLPASWLRDGFPSHVWMGFSAEDQIRYDERARAAVDLGAAITFCSYEPALGSIDFRLGEIPLQWVIGGGESSNPASRARAMHPAWMRSARDQCVAAGVAFHFKQWGEYRQMQAQAQSTCPASGRSASGSYTSYPSKVMDDGTIMERVGRKVAGRMLDGRTWDEFPATA